MASAIIIGNATNVAYAQQQDKEQATAQKAADAQEEEEVVAYSDTTAVPDTTIYYNGKTYNPADYANDLDDDLTIGQKWLLGILGGTAGVGATIFALFVVILVFVFLCSPFIIVALIIWYLVRKNNQRMEFARKAMESGQPIPQEVLSTERQTNQYLWRKGIRNIFLGIGLFFSGCFLKSEIVVSVGILILCMGIGQAIIYKTSNKNNRQGKDNGEDEQLG